MTPLRQFLHGYSPNVIPELSHMPVFCAMICHNELDRKGGEERVKKIMSKESLDKEAAYWNLMKQLAKQNPGTVCRK
jgi:hypothetical protein